MTGGDPTMASRGEDARLKGTNRVSAAERKRASQARRGLVDELDYGDEEEITREGANRDRWQG
jgi:GTPase obg